MVYQSQQGLQGRLEIVMRLLTEHSEAYFQPCQQLPDLIVKFPPNIAPLLFLGLDQSVR